MIAISVNHIKKNYGEQTVLEDVSLSLEQGGIYGLVGRNGSGKTVLLKCICGLTKPDSGKITFPVFEKTPTIGIIIEEPGFLPSYSGIKNLLLLSGIRHVINREQAEQAMQMVGLDPRNKKHVGKYSMGMRQRLGIAQALMEQPEILLLDEPFNGLDQSGVEEIQELLINQAKSGVTILLASHHREDIDRLCRETYKMDRGAIERIEAY